MQAVGRQIASKRHPVAVGEERIKIYKRQMLLTAVSLEPAVYVAHLLLLTDEGLPCSDRLIERQKALDEQPCIWTLTANCLDEFLLSCKYR